MLLAAACGGGDGDAASPPPTDPPETPNPSPDTTPLSDPAAEVEAAYLAHRDLFQRLLEAPDPNDLELEQRLTGEALDTLRDNLTALQEAGQALRFGPQYAFEPLSIEVRNGEAAVEECIVDDGDRIDVETGQPIEPTPVATVLNRVTLLADDAGWRVTGIVQIDGWEGVAGCAG